MRLFISFTLLVLISRVEWSSCVPVLNEKDAQSQEAINGSFSASSSEESEPEAIAQNDDFSSSSSEEYNYDDDYASEQNESFVIIDDMIVRKESSRAGLVDAAWPNGVVPYSLSFSITPQQRTQILQAMNEIHEAVPCVSFRPITREDTYNVEFRNDAMNQGCSSYVGWQNRKNQPIQLAAICSKGNAIHEIMHALGFFHEQTRDDRDSYVTVNFQNIQPGYENNFKKDSELYPNADTDYFGVPYNYDSIMHYGKAYFSKNGANTIDVLNNPEALGNGDNVGQRDYISYGDVQMMRAKYNCTEPESSNGEGVDLVTTTTVAPAPTESTAAPPGEATTVGNEGEASTVKTTKSPVCQVNPNMPGCKQ